MNDENFFKGVYVIDCFSSVIVSERYANIYRISKELIVKLPASIDAVKSERIEDHLKRLFNEALLQKQAYDLGVRVPRVEGIFRIDICNNCKLHKKISVPGLVMEYIPGRHPHNDRGNVLFEELLKVEMSKARNAGFVPGIDSLFNQNIIWDDLRELVHLIDLGCWSVLR